MKLEEFKKINKRSKYRNHKCEFDGIKFDSKKEMRRYQELKILESQKEIAHLRLQTKFPIEVNGVKICTYRSDFDYKKLPSWKFVVEDTKGFRTSVYTIKKKLMRAVYGFEILET